MVPIQFDSFHVACDTQSPSNCSAQFALTRMAIGRIFVLQNGLVMLPQCYSLIALQPPNNAAIQFTCPTKDGDVITLVYPASGPASAIGNPQ